MTLKRSRSDMDSDHQRSNGLELLAAVTTGRVFTCKTCQREFSSFQALGGHRASHKKLPKLLPSSSSVVDTSSTTTSEESPVSPPKPKSHECSICGLEFAIGQALGGHMRRHRQQLADAAAREQALRHHQPLADAAASEHCEVLNFFEVSTIPLAKKSILSQRISLELDLDLRLAPPGSYNTSRHNLKDLMTPLS